MYGRGGIEKADLEQGLLNVIALKEDGDGDAARTAEGILAFIHEQWDQALEILQSNIDEGEDPDGFARWLILASAIEKDRNDKSASASYRSIRARYAQFPEYWYRGARAFSGAIAAEYAEYCIGLAPEGPFAAECRNILAVYAGLKAEDGLSLKSKLEIEYIVSRSVRQGDPEVLAPLIPLISLPDNPYTVYAVGALRAVASAPKFKEYLSAQASVSSGRLAERLAYICRG